MSVVTLTTDFGLADGYVGIMHGVIHAICPGVAIVDLTHQVPPQDVREAAYLLYAAYSYFAPNTVHCVVVDPGVGTERRAVGVQTPQGSFIAPDNGVLSYILAHEPVLASVSLTNPRYHLSHMSYTFHGRDLFAPAAAHLAGGVPLAELGEPISGLVSFSVPGVSVLNQNSLRGQVIHVDHFGNLVTGIGRLAREGENLSFTPPGFQHPFSFSAGKAQVRIGGRQIVSLQMTYGAVQPGELLALIGSAGHLEVAVAGGNAAETLGIGVGAEVILEVKNDGLS